MMTVGAAHIGGENGLLALLCGEGYEVERVAERGAAAAKVCGAVLRMLLASGAHWSRPSNIKPIR